MKSEAAGLVPSGSVGPTNRGWLRRQSGGTVPRRVTDGSIGGVSTVECLPERLEFLQGTLEVLILRSLQVCPNHAFGIAKFIEQQSADEFAVDNGTLYPGLQRLVQKGWIASQWKTSPNARRAKYYRLTSDGKRQLLTATSRWQRFVEAMSRVLAPEGK